jgi:hydrogenase/urease accessory protein HupE
MKTFIALILALLISSTAFAHQHITGAAASVASCGVSPSISGNDSVGVVTIGTGIVTACTVNFASTWSSTPVCSVVTDSVALSFGLTSMSASSFTVGLSGSLPGGKIYYKCVGSQ